MVLVVFRILLLLLLLLLLLVPSLSGHSDTNC